MSKATGSLPHPSRWIKCVSTQSNIRGVAIQATGLVQEIADRHGIQGQTQKGLGEAVVAGLLIGSFCKAGERINLNIQASGLYRQALIDAHPNGTVRGYVSERTEASAARFDGNLAGKGPWGSGLMSVLRTKGEEGKQPYIGTVPLVTGHLAKDLTYYWMQSEQIPSAVGLVTEVQGNKVISAGGFLVQALPGASAAEIMSIEHHINDLQSLAGELTQDADPIKLLSRIFQSSAFAVVEEKPLFFECNCSWSRVERALVLVGPSELRAMLKEDHHASVRCDFCAKEYEVTSEALEQMIAASESDSKPEN